MMKIFVNIYFLHFMVLAIPTIFYSFVADEFSYIFIIFGGGLLSLLRKEKIKTSQSAYIRTIAFAIVIATFQAVVFEVEDRFYLTSAEECYPFVICLGLMFSLYEEHSKYNMSILIISAFCMMFCGDIVFDLRYPNLGLDDSFGKVHFIRHVYIFSLVLYFPFFITLLRKSLPKQQSIVKARQVTGYKTRFFLIGFAILTLAVFLVPVKNMILPLIKDGDRFLAEKLMSFYDKKKSFSDEDDLRRDFNDYDADDNELLLSVKSDKAPGYLRAQVKVIYSSGTWKEQSRVLTQVKESQEEDTYKLKERQEDKIVNQYQIKYHKGLSLDKILHRGSTSELVLNVKDLQQSEDGTLAAKNFDGDLDLIEYEEPQLAGQLANKSLRQYLYLTPYIERELQAYKAEVFGANWDKKKPDQLIRKVVNYFSNYHYEFGVNLEEGKDPALAFLESPERKGHCEYFANSTALLLRSVGVPTRYVTGFYCVEKHPYEQKYLGRVHDLHAWVEAYDSNSQRWYVVEATPGDGMPSSQSDTTVLRSFFESIKQVFIDIVDAFKEGAVKEVILNFAKLILVFAMFLAKSVYGWTLILLLIFWKILRWYRRKQNAQDDLLNETFEEQRSKIDKVLEKKLHLSDLKSMTLYSLSQLPEVANDENLSKSLKEYEQLLYSGQEKDLAKVKELGREITKLLKGLKPSV